MSWGTSALSGMWEAAGELASSAGEKWETAANAETHTVLSSLWSSATSAAATAAGAVQESSASALQHAGVLARQTKLKGEISLLQSNVAAWKREWGEQSFDAFLEGDLTTVRTHTYRVQAKIEHIRIMMEEKRAQIRGLDDFGLEYDEILRASLRRWRIRLRAGKLVAAREDAIVGSQQPLLQLRSALRTWRVQIWRPASGEDPGTPAAAACEPHAEAQASGAERATALTGRTSSEAAGVSEGARPHDDESARAVDATGPSLMSPD